jgi:hypothetical protein
MSGASTGEAPNCLADADEVSGTDGDAEEETSATLLLLGALAVLVLWPPALFVSRWAIKAVALEQDASNGAGGDEALLFELLGRSEADDSSAGRLTTEADDACDTGNTGAATAEDATTFGGACVDGAECALPSAGKSSNAMARATSCSCDRSMLCMSGSTSESSVPK